MNVTREVDLIVESLFASGAVMQCTGVEKLFVSSICGVAVCKRALRPASAGGDEILKPNTRIISLLFARHQMAYQFTWQDNVFVRCLD